MSANGDEITRREVAWRLFASEFRDADFSYAESDEERAPNYVVTPTGARINRLFVVGVLTEVEHVSDDYLRARVVDPTGAFVVYAGQYQPEALTFLEGVETPTFVAVTGKARTFQPDDSDVVYTSIRPESISEVDAATRDNWIVSTAEQTIERLATMADALELVERGDDLRAVLEARHVPPGLAAGIPLAIEHYGTTEHYLASTRDLALDAARVVAGEREEVRQHAVAPGDTVDEPVDIGLEDRSLVTGDAQPDTTPEADAMPEPDATAEPVAGHTGDTDGDTATADVEADTDDEETQPDDVEAEPDDVDTDIDDVEADTDNTDTDDEETQPDDVEADTNDVEADTDDTDEMYELSEEERQEVEENFDVGFSTADEVEGEAGIEPETPSPADGEVAGDDDTTAETAEPGDESEEAVEETAAEFEDDHDAEPETSDAEREGSPTEDLEDAVVATMQELGDGQGADRDELVRSVMEAHSVDQDAVEDAIQDALMSGRCYESGDDELTAI